MDPLPPLLAFTLAATLLTLTPGADTALVLRTAAREGARPGMAAGLAAGLGVVVGVMAWGLIASLGLGAALAASPALYGALTVAGALYLAWLGLGLMRRALRRPAPEDGPEAPFAPPGAVALAPWFRRGLMTNLLNPKVGLFYMGFLPQFVPPDAPLVAYSMGLAAIHAALGLVWFTLLCLATRPFARLLRHPTLARLLDGTTGAILMAFGLALLLERRA